MAGSMQIDGSDWQIGIKSISRRADRILESGQWSDCTFIVGTEERRETIQAHKLFLAMSSPVFEAMFYGSLAPKDDKPIEILDVQPKAFRALLKYIYTDKMHFVSFDQVCEICYAAKKYMIPTLVEECTKYIWKDVHPGNVCRAYAFVRLFEEPNLLEKCMDMIKCRTFDVVKDKSFEEVDTCTLKSILSQDKLNISELELWNGVVRWSEQECERQNLEVTPSNQRKVMEELIPLIRFLSFSPRDFASGPGKSDILTREESFTLLMNISSPGVAPTPPSFCESAEPRKSVSLADQETDVDVDELPGRAACKCVGFFSSIFLNEQLVDCTLSFSVSRCVRILGITLPTQVKESFQPVTNFGTVDARTEQSGTSIFPNFGESFGFGQNYSSQRLPYRSNQPDRYPELIYAFLQDSDGCRVTYTHFSAPVCWDSTMEVLFNRPINVVANRTYKIVVVLNKMGRYRAYLTQKHVRVNNVVFNFTENESHESIVKTLFFQSTLIS